MRSFVNRYLLPGLVFQGIVIGGGYATGRELAEFFLPSGPLGGLLGLCVSALIWSVVMAVSFELCRQAKTYEYRGFFKLLLGRFWVLYEVLYFILMILVLAVIGAAAGVIVHNLLNLDSFFGTFILLVMTGVLAFYGSAVVERFMGLWSVLLYVFYFTMVAWTVYLFSGDIEHSFSTRGIAGNWVLDGIRYAGYNLAAVPAVFFCLRHIEQRHEAFTAGAIAGIIAILPAVFLYVAMMSEYPEISAAILPSTVLLAQLDAPWFEVLFQIVLLGTFVQTGIGLVHIVNERIFATLHERGHSLAPMARGLIAAFLLAIAVLLSVYVGIIDLIGRGYGMLTYAFIAVFVIPVMTVGLMKIMGRKLKK